MNVEQIGLWAGFVLTLMTFSYVLGDNFLYRLAVHVFVGLAAGFITVVTVESVILPWIRGTITATDSPLTTVVSGFVPFVLALLLLFKSSQRLGRFGNLAIAFIIGVGVAVAVVGALSGTLLPLAGATGREVGDETLDSALIVVGVVSSLVYFQYLARRSASGEVRRGLPIRAISSVGQGFIAVALGALYASAIMTSLTIFSERVGFILARINGS